MSKPVTFENEYFRFTTYPQLGGKVSSIIDRADGFELLHPPATDAPELSQYGMNYAQGWSGGWDECFPSVKSAIYPLDPYRGIAIPDHGEIWSLPTTAVPTKNGITTVWHGLRFGYRITRKLYLKENAIIADYTLINLAPFAFRFNGGAAMQLSVQKGMTIASGDPGIDSLRVDQDTKCCVSQAAIQNALRINYPDRNRGLNIEYQSSSNMNGYWGVQVSGRETIKPQLIVAPITGRSFDLVESIQDDSAATIESMGRLDWGMIVTV